MLPFLYPRALRTRAPAARALVRCLHDSASPDSAPPPPPATTPPRPRRPPPFQRDHIPFELPDDVAADLAKEKEAEADKGTITPMERQAFRRLFGDLAERQRAAEAAERVAEALATQDDRVPIRDRVNRIVDEAAEEAAAEQRALSQTPFPSHNTPSLSMDDRRLQVLMSFPPSLRTAASKALGIKEAAMQEAAQRAAAASGGGGAEAAEEVTPLKRAIADPDVAARQEQLELLMLAQKTDVQLWQVMESKVFSLVEEMGLGATTKTTTKTGTRTRTTRTKPKAKDLKYAPMYPALLLHGLRLLDSHFNGGRTSPLAFRVMPRIQSLGVASHALGASTPLYNGLMRLHWARRGDVGAVFALLHEMRRLGVAYDGDTRALLQSMEYHLSPVYGQAGLARKAQLAGAGAGAGVSASGPTRPMTDGARPFVTRAVQKLPWMRVVPEQLQAWKAEVNRGSARRA